MENCRQKSKTVRLSKASWQRHKHVSPANKLFYSLLLLVFQALQAKCLHCCVDSGINLLFAVPGHVYLVWLATLPPERFCTLLLRLTFLINTCPKISALWTLPPWVIPQTLLLPFAPPEGGARDETKSK